METWIMQVLILIAGVMALGFVGYLVSTILRESEGTDKMKEIAQAIRQGAMAFLRREYITLGVFTIVMFIVLAVFINPKPLVAVAAPVLHRRQEPGLLYLDGLDAHDAASVVTA